MTTQSEGTVLIADDDEFFRFALARILLKDLQFSEVIETSSFDEAMARLSESPGVDLALFDLAMPGMENPESLRAVRENFPEMRLAVVSGSRRRKDILSALWAGVHGFVPKGIGVSEVAKALQTIVEGAIYVPPSLAEIEPSSTVAARAQQAKSATEPSTPLSALTARQRDVLYLIVEGKANKEIARALDLGEGTIKVHLAALMRNLGVNNRAAVAAIGVRLLAAGVGQPSPEASEPTLAPPVH